MTPPSAGDTFPAPDRTDLRILDLVQRDARLSTAELSERVGLSTTSCWRRLQKLDERDTIIGRVAQLNRGHLNRGVDAFVSIRTDQHKRALVRGVRRRGRGVS